MNDAELLSQILAENPFTTEVVNGWRNQLQRLRKADYEEVSNASYLLPCDVDFIERNREQADIKTNIPPQPYIGSPLADIWYIQINPSFSMPDYYDMVSISGDIKAHVVRECGNVNFHGDTNLQERQNLLLNQYLLNVDGDYPFYPIAPSFNTLDYNGRNALGMYRWWMRSLCVNNRDAIFADVFQNGRSQCEKANELGRRFFVLEFFPYHSKQFRVNRDDYTNSPYYGFVRRMVDYAMQMNKTILFRSTRECELLNCNQYGNANVARCARRVALTNFNFNL